MASFLTWKSLSYILFCILLTHVQALNDTNATGTTDFSAVVLSDEAAFGVCVYPTSGSYSFLSRILYYCTLVFSLFSRTHLWLVVGALASALTYSGAAAIHACLLTWRGPNPYIENDGWSLLTILTTASLITVPLLNWSGTLRRLGAKVAALKDGKKGGHTQSEVGTRTIVVYWALLVLVGFICAWNQSYWGEGETNMEYPEMSKVMCRPGTNASMIRSHNGTLVRRAIDRNFIMQNGCSNPCDQIDIPSIFRQQQDLQLMSVTESLLWNGSYPSEGYKTAEKTIDAQNRLLKMYFYALPFILLQGFITMFFGRRDPREIRDLIYFKMYMERDGRHGDKCECLHEVGRKSKSRQKHECHHEVECQCDYKCRLLDGKRPPVRVIQDWTARVVAFLSYIISVLMVIICPPFFVILVFLHEWGGYIEIPDAEMPKAVGQWSPWAVAGQAICAALIGKYHDKVMIQLGKLYRWIKKTCFHPLLSKCLPQHRHRRQHYPLPPEDKTAAEETAYNPSYSYTPSPNPDPEFGLKVPTSTTTTPATAPIPPRPKVVRLASPPLRAQVRGTTPENEPEPSFYQDCSDTLYYIYKIFSHPLNQSDGGIGDEIKNFLSWCKDPQAVSRKVVRYPLRPMDGQTVKERAELRGRVRGVTVGSLGRRV